MTFEADAAAVGRAADEKVLAVTVERDAARNELTLASAQVSALAGELATATGTIAAQATRIGVLEAEVRRLTDLYEPKPPTLFGVTVTGPTRNTYTDLHPQVAVSRVYAQGVTNWVNEPQHKVFPDGAWAVSSSYSLREADLPRFLATIPDADKSNIHAYAYGHELEHPDKGLVASTVKATTKRTAPIIRAAGLRVAVCMMGWSLRNEDWLDWVDPDDVDVLCWDKYNSGNKKTPPVYQDPVQMVDEMVAASVRFGKPFAVWETGTNQFGDQAARVAWVEALKAELIAQGAETAIWFDRKSTSGSTWDASLDRASAEAWLG